jgi:V/A-type H+-transporting ATPase subunit I
MAIVKLKKITLYTLSKNLKVFLSRLQDLGVMHVISLTNKTEQIKVPESERKAKEALQFLLSAPRRRGQVHTKKTFDAHSIKTETLKLKNSLQKRIEEREALKKRIKDIKPWGNFSYNTRESRDPYKLWFYQVPHRKLSILEECDQIWQNCGKDHRFYYIVVISEQKPKLPFKRTHIGEKSLFLLQDQLEDRWLDLYIKEMHRLENMEHYEQVHNEVYEDDTVMVIQGWVPAKDMEALQTFAYQNHAAFLLEDPQANETPPTLLKNKNLFSAGENLLTFYTVPNYFEHDTSTIIFFSFILFFGMILGDAGYGILLGVMTLIFYKKMQQSETGKRFVPLLLFLSLATIVWGMMVGSYFGTPPPENSWLSALQFFDINDYDTREYLLPWVGSYRSWVVYSTIFK